MLLVLFLMLVYSWISYYKMDRMRTRYRQEIDDCFDAQIRLLAGQSLTESQIELLHRIDPDVADEYETRQRR